MKKVFKIMVLVLVLFSLVGCEKEEPKKEQEKKTPNETTEKKYYEDLPMPTDEITRIDKNFKTEDKIEYIMYVNDYSYDKFYEYIMKLEKIGFHYEFVSDSVPDNASKLYDKTETSWAANNGKIWIRASWRSNKNQYYTDYNLQLIFNNYDYLLPIEELNKEMKKATGEN